jgi:hypothetical protein
MELFSYILSQSVHCWCIERLLILYTTTLLKLFVVYRYFGVEFFSSLSIRSCHLQIRIVWFLPYLFVLFLFLLILLLWLGIP